MTSSSEKFEPVGTSEADRSAQGVNIASSRANLRPLALRPGPVGLVSTALSDQMQVSDLPSGDIFGLM